MKGFLIISFLVLLLLYAATAQDECIRVETSEAFSVDVNWCSQPVTGSLPGPIGYCTNARCKSSHKTHLSPEEVISGCCRAKNSVTSVASVTATCPGGESRTINVKYTDIQSCECIKQ